MGDTLARVLRAASLEVAYQLLQQMAQGLQHTEGELGLAPQRVVDGVAGQETQVRPSEHLHENRARDGVEHDRLAEAVTRLHHPDDALVAVAREQIDLQGAFEHGVHAVEALSPAHEQLPAWDLQPPRLRDNGTRGLRCQGRKQR